MIRRSPRSGLYRPTSSNGYPILLRVPRGRPVFPGVGNGVAAEEPLKKSGLVLKNTRMLDPVTETVVQEWGPKA